MEPAPTPRTRKRQNERELAAAHEATQTKYSFYPLTCSFLPFLSIILIVRVFTRWVNMHLKKRGLAVKGDIAEEFANGVLLLKLLTILTDAHVKIPNKKPKMRVQEVENCSAALKFITSQTYVDHKGKTVNIKLTNISGRDLADKKKKLLLGLIFTLIIRLQVSDASGNILASFLLSFVVSISTVSFS